MRVYLAVLAGLFLVGCTEELLLIDGGGGSGTACSDADTYCLDLLLLSGDYATEDFTYVSDNRSIDNQTYYYNLTSA